MNPFARFRVAGLAATLLLAPTLALARGTIEMVEDLNPSLLSTTDAGAARPAAVGSQIFFSGREAQTGVELWRTDGTAGGTELVRDIHPGAAGSFPTAPIDVDGVAFFVADDGEHGEELWTSDGTRGGTRLVRDIMPGPDESDTWNLVVMNGILYFNADDGVAASELWRSDGTTAGTRLIKDIWPGPEHGAPVRLTVVGDRIFFVANDGEHGNELWVTDGTTSGTRMVTDLWPGIDDGLDGARKDRLVVAGNQVFFQGNDGVHGAELWKSDGTAQGTTLVRDIVPGLDDAQALPRVALGGRAFFTVVDPATEQTHLWSSDGTVAGTQLVVEVGPHRGESLVESGGKIYFVARTGQLWVTDGSRQGTILVGDVRAPIGCASNHYFDDITAAGGRVFLVGRATKRDVELWTSDGTEAGTYEVRDIVDPTGSFPRDLAVLGDQVFFVANDRIHGSELWTSDGTADGTRLVADLLKTSGDFFQEGYEDHAPAAVGSEVFFAQGGKLYRSDGSAQGTGVVPGTESLLVATPNDVEQPVVSANGQAFFWEKSAGTRVLWQTDGTRSGTKRVLEGGPLSSSAVAFDDAAYVSLGVIGASNRSLWKVSGGESTLVKDFASGRAGPDLFSPAARQLYFRADDGEHGQEIWRTDGTVAGTRLVKDIFPGPLGGIYDSEVPLVAGNDLYFVADDGAHGFEVWHSDGTEAGTFLVEDVAPGPDHGIDFIDVAWAGTPSGRLFLLRDRRDAEDFQNFDLWTTDGKRPGLQHVATLPLWRINEPSIVALGEVAYFVVRGDDGPILWQSDGTSAGTRPFKPEVGVDQMAVVDGALYFAIRTGDRVQSVIDLWVTDGSEAGTQKLATLLGDFTGLPLATLVRAEGRLFAVGSDGVHGRELFAFSCGDGAVRDGERCDEGVRNGTPSSSCSLACEIAESQGRRWHRVPEIKDGGSSPGGGPLGPRPSRGRRVPTRS